MDKMREGILFVCESRGSLDIAKRIVNQYNFECPLYLFTLSNLVKDNDSLINGFDHFTTEPYTLPGTLAKIKLVLFGAHESSPHCRLSNAIGFLAKQTGTAHASIQHGWIQPGLNFTTQIKRIDYRGIETDNSRSLVHFSEVLEFFGEQGIGYPYPEIKRESHSRSKSHVVIATNFNWGVYTSGQIANFIESVKLVRAAYPRAHIVHRPHPAERKEQIERDWGNIHLDLNITCTRDMPEYLDLGWPDIVISTPSTVALDYIACDTPTILYSPETFEKFIQELSFQNRSFATTEEFKAILNCKQINETSLIPKFPSAKFAETISALIESNRPFEISEDIFFRFGELLKL